jgi:hypothetical protein
MSWVIPSILQTLFSCAYPDDAKPWLIYDYRPDLIQHLSFGGWGDGKLLGIWFVARKLENSSCDVTPQQGAYLKAWSRTQNNQLNEAVQKSSTSNSLLLRTKSFVKSNEFLYPFCLNLYLFYHRNLRPLPRLKKPSVIAKY